MLTNIPISEYRIGVRLHFFLVREVLPLFLKPVQPEQIELTVINNTSIDLETQAKKIQGTGIRNSKSILELLYPTSHALNIIQTEKEESRKSELRIKNAKKRLESLYPDSHTLDVILSNNAFTVSLIIKPSLLDKVHNS